MKVVIDFDEHQAIEDFGVRSPVSPFVFKSEDTVDFLIYFVRAGVVQDLGAGFALKFGMIRAGDSTNTLLAYQTVFSYRTDSAGNVYYLTQVNFNTAQMATAIGTNEAISCTIELRYQTSDGEIVHTLNLPATVYATILLETGTVPPSIDGSYPDPSAIELIAHKNAANGYAGLDSTGKIFTTQLSGTVELVANKGQASGYAGLDTNSLLNPAEIPVDGSTIVISSGKLAAPFVGGDMKKSVYDANNDGITDHAALADTATTATTATTAAGLTVASVLGSLSEVWGRDASGGQGLFVAPSGGGSGGVSSLTDAISSPGQSLIYASTGILRRIIQGANITLDTATTPGGIIISAAAGGGGGVAALTDAETTTGYTLIYNSTGVLKRIIPTDATIFITDNGQTLGIKVSLVDAETSSGITLLGSTNGQIKRLIAGSNITLDVNTTPGGVIINSPVGGGGVSSLTDAETSVGVTLISSSTGVLKRLVPGVGITLTPDSPTVGGITIDATGGGGGSSGVFDPATGLYFYDDLFTPSTAIDGNRYGSQLNTGTCNALTTYGQSNTALKILGAYELATGTSSSANVGASLFWGSDATTAYPILYGLGALTWKSRIFIEGTLPASGISYFFRAGIGQKSGTFYGYSNTPIQGFFFEYDPAFNSGQWRVGYGAGSITYANTTVAVAGDTAYNLEIDLNAAWTSLVFKINGTTVSTISSGFPTNVYGCPVWALGRGTGSSTSFKAAIDWWMINYTFTR